MLLLQILGLGALWVVFGALVGRHESRQMQVNPKPSFSKAEEANTVLNKATVATY